MMKFNLIAHLVGWGILWDQKIFCDIYHTYMNTENEEKLSEEELHQALESIEVLTIEFEDGFVGLEEPKRKESGFERLKNKFQKILPGKFSRRKFAPGKYEVKDIRGMMLNTPESGKAYGLIYQNVNNVYLSKRVIKKLKRFENAYLKIILGKMHEIISREESRALSNKGAGEIVLHFDRFLNELMESKEVRIFFRRYKDMKKEIRKSLKIDARW